MATEVLDREQLINSIWKARGKVSLVARDLGVAVRTVYYYAERYATVQNALDVAREHWEEGFLDTAELKLRDAVYDGQAWAIKYTLSTKGKERGYVERSEVTGKDGDDIAVKLTWGDHADDDD